MFPSEKLALHPLKACSQEIAMRLRALRKEAGFKTEKSFAEKYGIPLTTYSQHETGKRRISAETCINYCVKLNANVCWMLTGAGDPFAKPSTTMQIGGAQGLGEKKLGTLRQVLLSAQSFLSNGQLSFSEWVDRCLEIGMALPAQKIDDEKIEKIVKLVFVKIS
ncbi:MAG: family transcriptional regulator [Gammaproteobacteria bacterium]|jgi:DNA-binding XRE family transcriptional regulator|nr:family transcriptional regulator [Gammaproteobacteria bacterium]